MRKVTVAGSAAVWDYIFQVDRLPQPGDIVQLRNDGEKPYPGGCAPNIAVSIARLCGCAPQLRYPVGCEFERSGLRRRWEEAGVDCSALTPSERVRSGCAWLYMQPDGTTMCFAYPGAAGAAGAGDADGLGEWVVVAPVLNAYTGAILNRAAAQNRNIVLTGICSDQLIPYLPALKAAVMNRHEAQILLERMGLERMEELARRYADTLFYVTKGKEGSALYRGDRVEPIPLIPERRAVDVTGAGDAYTGGVVSGLIEGVDPADAGYLGAVNSSFAVEQFGGQTGLPTWEALVERLAAAEPARAKRIVDRWNKTEAQDGQ